MPRGACRILWSSSNKRLLSSKGLVPSSRRSVTVLITKAPSGDRREVPEGAKAAVALTPSAGRSTASAQALPRSHEAVPGRSRLQ
jgi:hypothetical protein